MYQNRLKNIIQIIEVQNTKLLKNKQKELPVPKETIIDMKILSIMIMKKI